eukprot:scaffold494573_cov53-Prasinocladus_malaysianus.AAC.1
MQRMSGMTSNREELCKQYQLPVFTVSGMDYQKLCGVRDGDGEAKVTPSGGSPVWKSEEDTEIPALRRFVHNAALSRRRISMRKQAESVVHFCDSIAALIEDDGTKDLNLRQQVRNIFNAVVVPRLIVYLHWEISRPFLAWACSLSQRIKVDMSEFNKALTVYFSSDIGTQLESGATTGSLEVSTHSATFHHYYAESVMATVRGWGNKPREGGMAWTTYKAHTRRGGVFRCNMNEEMAEPVYRSVSTYWWGQRLLPLTETFHSIKTQESAMIQELIVKFKNALMEQSGMESVTSRYDSISRAVEASCIARVQNAVDQAKDIGRNMQREVNRSITPAIQEQMMSAYDQATMEAGPGSHARRKAIIEGHVDSQRGAMFKMAIRPVLEGLNTLRSNLVQT